MRFLAMCAVASCACAAVAAVPAKRPFGVTKYGEKASLYEIEGRGGLRLVVSDDGGKVVRLCAPDAKGALADVTIGFDSPAGWETTDAYFGAIIGRVGNRIAEGRFALDGRTYEIARNDATHHAALHGGARGWSSYVWDAEPFERGTDVGVAFTKTFPDGESGFPGTVRAKVTYTVTAANDWRIEYEATTDKATPINLTHHVYFNLDGEGTILGQELRILASRYLPVDADLKPVGGPAPVEGTPFDFREFRKVGERIDDPDRVLRYGPGYDHNWCLDGEGFRKVAEMRGATRRMEVWTDQPGLQFYAGNFIDPAWKMKDGRPMVRRGHLALETQHWPNTPNRPDFGSVTLRPGEKYRTVTEYRFRAR